MAVWSGWEQDVLRALGDVPTSADIQFLDSWQRAEGGGAVYNPLNTTLTEPGATDYNTVGVKNYTSPAQGAQATAQTLEGATAYAPIVQALATGNPYTYDRSSIAAALTYWVSGSTSPIDTQYVANVMGGGSEGTNPGAPSGTTGPSGGSTSGGTVHVCGSDHNASSRVGFGVFFCDCFPWETWGQCADRIGSRPIGGAINTAASTLDLAKKVITFIFSYRFLELVGGAVLIVIGLYLLAKETGLTSTAPRIVERVADYGPERAYRRRAYRSSSSGSSDVTRRESVGGGSASEARARRRRVREGAARLDEGEIPF